jgi:hypothetical protein
MPFLRRANKDIIKTRKILMDVKIGFVYKVTPADIRKVATDIVRIEAFNQSMIFVLYRTRPSISQTIPWINLNGVTK